MSSLPVNSSRRSHERVVSFAALALVASALFAPAGAQAVPPSSSPPAAAEPPAPPPASAETPQAPAAAESPSAPAATAPAFEMPIKATVPIVYLGKQYEEPLPLSYAEKPIFDKGIQGARLIAKEANQAGRFVGYAFNLVEAIVPANADVVAKA